MSALEKAVMLNGSISGDKLPPPGPNKLIQAMEDYDHLVAENEHLRIELAQYTDIASKMTHENASLRDQIKVQGEFLSRQVAMVTQQRDRLLVVVKGLTTRFKVIKECFAQCEKEAIAEGISAHEKVAVISPEEEKALSELRLSERQPWQDKLDSAAGIKINPPPG